MVCRIITYRRSTARVLLMIVIATRIPKVQKWLEDAFARYAPADSYCLMDSELAQHATTAIAWFPDLEQLQQLKNLKLIHSMAAGVEHLNLDQIKGHYKVCRVVDHHHQQGMFDYLQWGVLYYQRYFDLILAQQKQQIWQQHPQRDNASVTIGIMGLGHMGSFIATELASRGYQVLGWSRSEKNLSAVKCYSGQESFHDFLAQSEILINLLPLTQETKAILSKPTFDHLPQHACIINCGRGQHLLEEDLLDYLDQKRLRGAILDVFQQEPLAKDHPFWLHPNIVVSPHMASHAPWSVVVKQALDNDQRIQAGRELVNSVDIEKGY